MRQNKQPKPKSKSLFSKLASFWSKRSLLAKIMLSLLAVFLLFCSWLWLAGRWYISQQKDQPLEWGISWSSKYAQEMGIDSMDGLEYSLQQLPIKRVRLMSYWDLHEPENNRYNWQELDQQIELAKKYKVKVSLAIGLRQPRWPECHMPSWAAQMPAENWRTELNDYLRKTIERYDSQPIIVEYQLENEFLTKFFGECPDHDRQRLVNEYQLVKSLTKKPIVVSRSNNFLPSWPVGEPRADKTAFSIYKRVYNPFGYYEYPYPAWFYAGIAGMTKLTTGVDTFVHELQAEPWGPAGTVNLSLEEQYKSMSPERLKKRLSYSHATGMRQIDLWGAEWWYYLKQEHNISDFYQVLKTEMPRYN